MLYIHVTVYVGSARRPRRELLKSSRLWSELLKSLKKGVNDRRTLLHISTVNPSAGAPSHESVLSLSSVCSNRTWLLLKGKHWVTSAAARSRLLLDAILSWDIKNIPMMPSDSTSGERSCDPDPAARRLFSVWYKTLMISVCWFRQWRWWIHDVSTG